MSFSQLQNRPYRADDRYREIIIVPGSEPNKTRGPQSGADDRYREIIIVPSKPRHSISRSSQGADIIKSENQRNVKSL